MWWSSTVFSCLVVLDWYSSMYRWMTSWYRRLPGWFNTFFPRMKIMSCSRGSYQSGRSSGSSFCCRVLLLLLVLFLFRRKRRVDDATVDGSPLAPSSSSDADRESVLLRVPSLNLFLRFVERSMVFPPCCCLVPDNGQVEVAGHSTALIVRSVSEQQQSHTNRRTEKARQDGSGRV